MYDTILLVLYVVSFMALILCSAQIFKLRRRMNLFHQKPWLKLKMTKVDVVFDLGSPSSDLKRDGELIAFCRLYELTKAKRSIQLSLFAENVAPHFPAIKSDLLQFSQMLTTTGSEAYIWLEGRFPKSKFIRNVCAFLQTAESLADPRQFLKQNATLLEKLSADQFRRRKDFQAPYLTAANSIPTMLIFLMVILEMIQYMNIVQQSIQYN